MKRRSFVHCFVLLLAIAIAPAYAQKGAGQNQPSSGSGQSAGSLPGLSWPRGSWDTDLGQPPFLDNPHTVLACYTLAYGNSGSQPFVLKPATTSDERAPFGQTCQVDANGNLVGSESHKSLCEASFQQKLAELTWTVTKMQEAAVGGENLADAQTAVENAKTSKYKGIKWSNCANLDAEHPIKMGQKFVIGIDAAHIDLSRIKILNLNLTNQQGNPINPTPVRPSFTASATSPTNLGPGGPYYLTWPNQIPGDVIPTVNVNAVYTAPIPGDRWAPGTFYPAGSVVTSSSGNGHYYVAMIGGVSSDKQQDEPPFPASSVMQISDGGAQWVDTGNTAPGNNTPVALWQHSLYAPRQVIFDPYNGHYYTNLAAGSLACPGGQATNCVQTGVAPTDPFSTPAILDGSVLWEDRGNTSPTTPPPPARTPGTNYASRAWVSAPNGDYYQAVQAGITSATDFVFPVVPIPISVTDGTIVWTQTSCTPPGTIVGSWTAFTPYSQCDAITTSNGNIYVAVQTGQSGPVPTQPFFPISQTLSTVTEVASAAQPNLKIKWEDAGTTPPQSVSTGQPADTTVSLLNLQYAQSHSLSYYNLASGVLYSTVHSRTFGFQPPGCSGSTCTAVQTGGSPGIDPVLLFSIYPWPWDAEAHCPKNWCLGHFRSNPPGLSFGLSLSSPASSFYAGGSLEVIRNLQLVVAANFNKRAQLPPNSTAQPSSAISSGTPVTVQKFATGGAFGLTLNISGFIQSLFGGGGKGGGGGGGSQGGAPSGSSQ